MSNEELLKMYEAIKADPANWCEPPPVNVLSTLPGICNRIWYWNRFMLYIIPCWICLRMAKYER